MDLDRHSYSTIREWFTAHDLAIIPVGAIEQHGPGCSLGTDARIPDLISRRIADDLGILRIPILSYGVSTDHLRFPGTVAVRPSTLAALFRDVFSSLYLHGARRFVVLNGHFDNAHCLKGEILSLMHEYDNALIYLKDFWDFDEVREIMQRRFGETGGHGDATDVALMLYLAPDEVVVDQLVKEWPQFEFFISSNLHEQFVTKSGVIGSDQRKATREAGEELYGAILRGLTKDIERILSVKLPASVSDHRPAAAL